MLAEAGALTAWATPPAHDMILWVVWWRGGHLSALYPFISFVLNDCTTHLSKPFPESFVLSWLHFQYFDNIDVKVKLHVVKS
jgi:hypothetical protein